jgi:phage shock protein PspC (stress-responsive transcriptional regulator)
MRTVITISLNGNAYQLDAVGFDALRAYLQVAEQRLAGNPDQDEILADLEQAIADKCSRYLGPHKNVVSAAEVTEVLREMGPVDGEAYGTGATAADASPGSAAGSGDTTGPGLGGAGGSPGVDGETNMGPGGLGSAGGIGGEAGAAGTWTAGSNGANAGSWSASGASDPTGQSGAATDPAGGPNSTVRRLYQIREGAVISGVCKGLAAYLNLDVSIVRILFIILTILTGGAWILVYIVMMFVIPYAETSEQHAAAHGLPFTAEEVITRAKAYYAAFTSDEKWRRQQWREQRRMWRSQNKMWKEQRRAWERSGGAAGGAPPPPPPWTATPPTTNMSYSSQVMSGVLTPLVELIGALLFVAFLYGLFSLAARHRIFGWSLPGDVPPWVAILVLIVLYRALVSPLRHARQAAYYGTAFGAGWLALWGVLVWLAILSYFAWLAWQHWADVRYFFEQLTVTLRSLINHGPPANSQPFEATLQWGSGLLQLPWTFGKLQAHG